VYCVWQVVKTPTIISNYPVYIYIYIYIYTCILISPSILASVPIMVYSPRASKDTVCIVYKYTSRPQMLHALSTQSPPNLIILIMLDEEYINSSSRVVIHLLMYKYSSLHPRSEISCNHCTFLSVRNQVSHPYKTAGKLTVSVGVQAGTIR